MKNVTVYEFQKFNLSTKSYGLSYPEIRLLFSSTELPEEQVKKELENESIIQIPNPKSGFGEFVMPGAKVKNTITTTYDLEIVFCKEIIRDGVGGCPIPIEPYACVRKNEAYQRAICIVNKALGAITEDSLKGAFETIREEAFYVREGLIFNYKDKMTGDEIRKIIESGQYQIIYTSGLEGIYFRFKATRTVDISERVAWQYSTPIIRENHEYMIQLIFLSQALTDGIVSRYGIPLIHSADGFSEYTEMQGEIPKILRNEGVEFMSLVSSLLLERMNYDEGLKDPMAELKECIKLVKNN